MVTDGNKKAAFFEKWNRLKRLPYLGRTTRKSITIFYHKGDCIAIFCHLKDVFYFADHRAKSDIFQRKNSKLQQILSVFKTLCPLTFAPPLKNQAARCAAFIFSMVEMKPSGFSYERLFVKFYLRKNRKKVDNQRKMILKSCFCLAPIRVL